MTTYSDTSIVQLPVPETPAEEVWGGARAGSPAGHSTRHASAATLTTLALMAGIGALALGALAVVLASTSRGEGSAEKVAPVATPAVSQTSPAERRALALLAKPSTERIVFRGSGGALVLAVGSGGKAAILMRGLELAPSERPYYAWLVGERRPVRAARFTGSERAVFLVSPVEKGARVAVATERASALRAGPGRMLAVRP